MDTLYLYKPAFWAHVVSSIAMLVAVILLIINYKKLIKLDGLELVKIFSILAIAIASHSQGHINLEQQYGYDPMAMFR
jgi:hypothetical protein